MSNRKHTLLALGAFTLLFFLYFWPVTFSGALLGPDDDRIQNLPAFLAPRGLWTPLLFAGWPLVADPLLQLWYPLPYLCHLLPLPLGWNVFVLSGYILSAFCMYLLVMELSKSRFASLIAGLAYSMSGFMMWSVRHTHIVHWIFMMPLLLLILEKLRQKPKTIFVVAGAAVVGLNVVNGQMQILAYTLGLCVVYACFRAATSPAQRGRFALSVALLLLGGVLLGMIQIAPTLELTRFSARAGFTFSDFLTYSMHPLQAFGLLFPYLTGGNDVPYFGTGYFGLQLRPPIQCYLGMLPLFLLGCSPALYRSNPQIIFWSTVAILCVLLTFGNATPLAWLLFHIPPYGMFRALYRLWAVANLGVAIICGITIAAIEKEQILPEARYKAALTVTFIFALAFYLASILLSALGKEMTKVGAEHLLASAFTNPALMAPLSLGLISLLVFLFWQRRPQNLAGKVLLVAVLIGDLGFAGWFCEWNKSALTVQDLSPPASAQLLKPLLDKSNQRILCVQGGSASRDEIPCNLSRLWQIANASGYEPLMLTRLGRLLDLTEGGFLQVPWTFKAENRCFDLLSIRYLTCARDDQRLAAYQRDGKKLFSKWQDSGTAAIYENASAMPRCWLVSRLVEMPAELVLQSIKTGLLPDQSAFDPASTALLEGSIGSEKKLPSKDSGDRADIETLENEKVTIEVSCKDAKFLVLSDVFYPGWTATVDGQQQAITSCDYILRGLTIPSGHHRVEFVYKPQSFYAGAIVSALALLLLSGLAVSTLRSGASKENT